MKSLKYFIILVFYGFSFFGFSQHYSSTLEKDAFSQYKNDSINYNFLKTLCVIDSTFNEANYTSYYNKLEHVIQSFSEKESKPKKEKKRVKFIYNEIHAQFLKKYDEKSFFTDIFKNGNYNCVTASAIYSYVFDRLQIPYHVKEAPSHVYLIAYPKTLKIYLETTVPGANGFISPKESEIKKIVDELVSLKLISQQELQFKGYSRAYQEYFYGKESVPKSSLIGMQYYNKSFFDYANADYKSAYKNITKSLHFYKSPISELFNTSLINIVLSELEVKSKNDLDILFNSLSTLKFKKDIDKNNLRVLMNRITENNENEFIEQVALKLADLNDDDIKKICQQRLYEYLASDHGDKQNLDKAITYGDLVLGLDNDNKRAKDIIIYAISKKLFIMIPSDKSIDLLHNYYVQYSFLKGDKRIETTRASHYGQISQKFFADKNPIKGMQYLNKFEEVLTTYKDEILINPQAITNLYLFAGRYYYGKSKFKNAIKIYQRGLKLSPDNSELKKMLKWAKEDL